MRACRGCHIEHDPLIDCRVVAARLVAAGNGRNQPKPAPKPETGLATAPRRGDRKTVDAPVPVVTHSARGVTHKPLSVTHTVEPVTHRTNAERQKAYREAHLDQTRKRNRERMAAKRTGTAKASKAG